MDEQTNNQDQLIIVAAIVINEERKALVARRSEDLKRSPGKWEFPSGRVDYGEDPLDALKRIVQSKTGLQVEAGKLISSKSFVSERSNKHVMIFYNLAGLVETDSLQTVELEKEYTQYSWVGMKEIQQLTLEKNIPELFGKLKHYLLGEDIINRVDVDITTSSHLIAYSDGGSRQSWTIG